MASRRRVPQVLAFALLLCLGVARAATGIDLEHHLPAGDEAWLAGIVERFNGSQRAVVVRLVAGSPKPAATLLLGDGRQVIDAGGDKAFRPLYQVMAESGQKLGKLLPEAQASVSDSLGRPLALPIALSTPVLFYNKAAFRAVGLDPERPPTTWFEVQTAADKLIDGGSACPFTTSRPGETLIEQTSLWHGEPVFGKTRQAVFNGQLQVKHIALMSSWVKSRFMIVFGREDAADDHFAKGECGMIAGGSNRYPAFASAGIDLGIGRLPFHDGYYGAPRHTVADGSAIWVGRGRSKTEYRAAARFISFLMSAETQTELVLVGGFMPFASAGKAAVASHLLADGLPQQKIALAQVTGGNGGAQLSRRPRAMLIVDEELEAVWEGRKPAKEALDTAVARIAALAPRTAGGSH